jgi:hypothetical protein
MNDKKKLELIDSMIGNYYEFCSFDDNAMNAGSLQMLIGAIEAVLMQDTEGEDAAKDAEDGEQEPAFVIRGVIPWDALFCGDCGDCESCECLKDEDEDEDKDEDCGEREAYDPVFCEGCDCEDECLQDAIEDAVQTAAALIEQYKRHHSDDA